MRKFVFQSSFSLIGRRFLSLSTKKIESITQKEFQNLALSSASSSASSSSAAAASLLPPLIIKDYLSSWPIIQEKKSFSDIVNANNNQELIVPIEIGGNYMSESFSRIQLDFKEFASFLDLNSNDIHENLKNEHLYLAQHCLSNYDFLLKNNNIIEPKELIKNIGRGIIQNGNIWMGTKSSSSPCHNDPFHNIIIQIKGQKQFTIYPPEVEPYLYLAKGTVQKNTVTIPTGDPSDASLFEKYPLLVYANKEKMQVTLQEGEALYMPLKYYHGIKNLTNSLSFNWFFL